MNIAQSLRSILPLIIGLAVGIVGAVMFAESMPGAAGSAEERAAKLEAELKKSRNRVAALEAESGSGGKSGGRSGDGKPGKTFADGARNIAEDLREGRPVSPEDIYRSSKPLLRDLAPIFDRMRVKQEQHAIQRMTGELARKYDLSPENQTALKEWFQRKSQEEAKRWSELISADGTRLEDLMRASREVRPDTGLDAFMSGILPPEKLAAFQSERMAERAQRVQQEADRKVQRLDSIVGLDETQRDQIFAVMARSSREYDPAMVLEGSQGEIGLTPSGNPQAAMLSILKPEQRTAFDAELQRRRETAMKEAETIGLTLPPGWEMLEDGF
ncbi:MAG TPA: hypothetical protein VF593_06015 [Chthoniobacteraceae bacterium]|jgi:hypothetical protein